MPYRVTKLKVFAAGFAKIVQYNASNACDCTVLAGGELQTFQF